MTSALGSIAPPPTYADPVVVNEISGKPAFNPVWLNWFLSVAQNFAALGSAITKNQFPVGALYLAITNTNPGTTFGYGTWVLVATGQVLVGYDGTDPDFNPAEKTGGAKTKAISAHAGTAVADHASHTHNTTATGTVSQPTFTGGAVTAASTVNTTHLVAADVSVAGVSPVTTATGTVSQPTFTGNAVTSTGPSATLTHTVTQPSNHTDLNVVQPYYVCYIWKRTA